MLRLPGMQKRTGAIGRRKAELILTAEERQALERYAKGRTVSQGLALRARIVLRCAEGLTNDQVAEDLDLWPQTVCKWRKRFVLERIDGLAETPRPNVHRKLQDETVEKVVRLTLESQPNGATHWSTRLMAKRTGVSRSSISRIWRAFHLKPHRRGTFTLSTDDFFVEKVRDVVGLYMNPPDHAVVLCVDEKSQIQALNRTQPVLPMVFGQPERVTPTYLRNGTTTLFAALDVATGKVIGECFPKHRSSEFRRFLQRIDAEVPPELEVHVIVDNYATHAHPTVKRWLGRHKRFHVHFTPTYSCWLNLVERWFALLTERQIKRGVHRSTRELEDAIRHYIDVHNEDPKPFVWTKTADEILASVSRFCQLTLQQADSSPIR
jgi:transposase